MTQTLDIPLPATRNDENRLVAGVCFAHFVSHIYITLLAPLFVFIKEDYAVTYTELGLAYTAFSVTSTLLQTPAGFLVDRVNARLVIVGGLILGAVAFAIAGLVNSYWVFVAMFGLAGIGNTAYHPADYALLSRHVPAERSGRIFSFHTFAGMLGNAATPPVLLFLQATVGWRGAFLGAAAIGAASAVLLLFLREPAKSFDDKFDDARADDAKPGAAPAAARRKSAGWDLLLSTPILLNLAFFVMLAFCTGGLSNYLVPSLGALHGTPPAVANTALTALLMMSAVGVLGGGVLAGWTTRHGLVAGLGLSVTATVCLLIGLADFNAAPVDLSAIGLIDPGALALVLLMSVAGFFSGVTMPSRDMIVRMVTPPGAYGRVFGFVSTGFNIAGIVSPLVFGQLLDHGYVREMFFIMALCALMAIGTIVLSTSRRKAADGVGA